MDSPAHDSERAPARGWRDGTRLFLAGLAVATVGLGLNWVARTNTDLVPLADFSRLGGQAIRPWLDGRLGTLELIVGDHEPGQKLSHVLATAAIGQWDARVLSIQSAVVQAAALAALGCFLIWALGRFRGVLAVVGFFAVAFASGMGPRPSASATVPELVITLGALQLVLAHGGGRAQLAGRCLAVFALLLDSLGLASVLAVALAKLTRRRTVSVVREFSFGDAALVVLGVGLVAWRGMRPETVAADAGLGAQSVWALFAAIPAGFCVWRSRRATAPDPILPRLSGAAWWALLLLLAGALWPGLPGEFTWAAFAINLACLGVLPRRGANWPARNVALGGLWTVVMVVRLLHPPAGTAPPVGPAVDSRDAAALRRAVLTHENAIDPGLLPVLPNSIRRPMSVAPSVREIRPGFSPGAAPELPGRDGWRTWGTWTPEGGGRQGTFLSEPLQTDFSLLQIRVAGRLQPPELSLVLVTSDGREIAPMETRFVAEGAWKRVNFAVPAGEFRIKAVDASDAHWIAFTGPAEVSRVSWLANKVARSGLGWAFLGAGAALAGAGVVLTLRTAGGEPIAAEATFDWRVAPWLAVLAYGLFWSHHLDPTAGP
ncbi:MAG TPA: hypothetical protein VEB66_09430, partial [Opitutaceae bacterium]|nr:hypothetical protein [Opitutaceae bacterium]